MNNSEPKDEEIDVLLALFEEHHRQLVAKRQKIHGITEKTLGAYLLIAGWLVSTQNPISPGVLGVIIGVVFVPAVASSKSVLTNNRSYYQVKKAIARINVSLRICEDGKFGLEDSIYPEKWAEYTKDGEFEGWVYHVLVIAAGATLCVIAGLMKLI